MTLKCAKFQTKTAILVGILDVGFLAAAVLVTQLALQGEKRIDAIGFLCAGLNILMYGSPLVATVRVESLIIYICFGFIGKCFISSMFTPKNWIFLMTDIGQLIKLNRNFPAERDIYSVYSLSFCLFLLR